jgi:hypothetical protein
VNAGNNTVTKIRSSDGTVLGTYSTGGSVPSGIAFDGAGIWITHSSYNSSTGLSIVSRLSVSDGSIIGSGHVEGSAHGVVFDGTSIWVTGMSAYQVTKLRVSDGATLGTYPVASYAYHLAFDGINVWVSYGGGVTRF